MMKSPYFLYVGNAYPHKNLETVLKAIMIINEQSNTKTLFVVGGSRDVFKERLEERIKKIGVESYVKFVGYVPDKDMANLYKRSVAFIYPSLSEGFGLQGLEALNSGTLLLASDTPVFKEIYENNALYFDPKNVSSLVEMMKKTLKMSSSERLSMVKKASEFIKRYSWQKMAKGTLEVYKEALNRN